MKNIVYTIILSLLFSSVCLADWEDVLDILLNDKEDRVSSREREQEERILISPVEKPKTENLGNLGKNSYWNLSTDDWKHQATRIWQRELNMFPKLKEMASDLTSSPLMNLGAKGLLRLKPQIAEEATPS